MAGTLENVKRWHLLFEQSGTFKKQFQKLGLEAIDYDILNDYGQTDVQIDIFSEIEKAFSGESSIFENVRGGKLFLHFSRASGFQSFSYGTCSKTRSNAKATPKKRSFRIS